MKKIKRIFLLIVMLVLFVTLQASSFTDIVMVPHTISYKLIDTWAGDKAKYEVYDNGVLIGYMVSQIQPSWFVDGQRTHYFPEKR